MKSSPNPGDRIRVEDAERIPNLGAALNFGSGDAGLLLQGVRIMGESTHRVAEAQPYLYHKLMEEPLMSSGMSERAMRDLITAVSPALGDTAERALVWMYRRHEEHATIEHLLEHLYGLMEEVGLQETRTDHPPAICFLDLVGYTRLTEERGDEAAAQTVSALADVVRANHEKSAEEIVKAVTSSLAHFIGRMRPQDDRTMIVIKMENN